MINRLTFLLRNRVQLVTRRKLSWFFHLEFILDFLFIYSVYTLTLTFDFDHLYYNFPPSFVLLLDGT
ncbi:uncharacterized protein BDW47DRAFT_100581 [Aspergillus candidus]|uniref:Uncharacterized protein n=1 Tax=Aspergillus candidus TaxID=41067 RepID=A0A2I2FKK6_ASPCN|nr:hypothetical protein BDW47DRAFT_100581 [Aspergillus candidus]PLB41153.1 hypothetical protein BDW47DRAFT_100581 [Aspergillus candidus]